MNFDWRKYLEFANILYAEKDDFDSALEEALLRSVISRAYYAAYKCAYNYACIEGFHSMRSGEDHKGVRKHFRESTNNTSGNKISTDLQRLSDNRKVADYEDLFKDASANGKAYISIETAKKIIEYLDNEPI